MIVKNLLSHSFRDFFNDQIHPSASRTVNSIVNIWMDLYCCTHTLEITYRSLGKIHRWIFSCEFVHDKIFSSLGVSNE